MNITAEFRKIFDGEQAMSENEQDVLLDTFLFMRDDREMGLAAEVIDVWNNKILGVIEFMSACGKISAEQEEDLCMMLNRIQSGEAETV